MTLLYDRYWGSVADNIHQLTYFIISPKTTSKSINYDIFVPGFLLSPLQPYLDQHNYLILPEWHVLCNLLGGNHDLLLLGWRLCSPHVFFVDPISRGLVQVLVQGVQQVPRGADMSPFQRGNVIVNACIVTLCSNTRVFIYWVNIW